jgi:hypothetical protein
MMSFVALASDATAVADADIVSLRKHGLSAKAECLCDRGYLAL